MRILYKTDDNFNVFSVITNTLFTLFNSYRTIKHNFFVSPVGVFFYLMWNVNM